MAYTSIYFLVFIASTILAYFVIPLGKHKWVVLLISSYVFYLVAGYRYIIFILITTISTYAFARWIESISVSSKAKVNEHKKEWNRETKKQFKAKTKRNMRLAMTMCLLLNFGILAFLKYYNFFAGSLNDIFNVCGNGLSLPTLKLLLPLGISFYTFQSMGYLVDVYRGKISAERNIAKFALFVSFFPQIIQGPISFYDQLAHQLYEPHKMEFTRFKHGCELILWGFFKKLVIADRAVIVINNVVADYSSHNGTTLTFIVLLYAVQLYMDFSGGIDISRGIAQILGIDMAENFRRPYFSKSINEYWRRWHITLGTWMKEYVFFPLSLSSVFLSVSKKMKASKFGKTAVGLYISKVLPTAVASLIVFIIVGVWHGASWKYVAFGLWNGGIIMLSILVKPLFDVLKSRLRINPKRIPWQFFQILRTFFVVCIGYVFDVAPSCKQAIQSFVLICCGQNISEFKEHIFKFGLQPFDYLIIFFGLIVLITVSIIQEKTGQQIRNLLDKRSFWMRYLIVLVGITLILTFGIYGPGYNASDFVYAQF